MVEFNAEIAGQLYELGLPLSSILVYADQKGVPSGLYSIFSDSLKLQWALEQADFKAIAATVKAFVRSECVPSQDDMPCPAKPLDIVVPDVDWAAIVVAVLVSACDELDIHLTLWHYNRYGRRFYPQTF